MHLCLVPLWFLCGGEKTGMLYVIIYYTRRCKVSGKAVLFFIIDVSRVKKSEARRAEQKYKWPKRSDGNGYIVGFVTKEPPGELVVNRRYSIFFTSVLL